MRPASAKEKAAAAEAAKAVKAAKTAQQAQGSQPSDGLVVKYVKRTRQETSPKKASAEKTPKKAGVEKTPTKTVGEKLPKKIVAEPSPKKTVALKSPKKTAPQKSPMKTGAEKSPKKTSFEKSPKKRGLEVAAASQAPKPEKPNLKKPTGGGFGVFMKEKREEITKSVAGQPCTAVIKRGAELYKALNEEERKPYHDKYVKLYETYKAAVAEYENACKLAGHTAETTPTKKSKTDGLVTPPKVRMAKVSSESAPAPDPECLHEAKGLGYEQAFRNLTAQKVLVEKRVPHDKIVRALRASGGVEKKAFAALRTFCPPSQLY